MRSATIKQALHRAAETLKSRGIEEARLEAELLLRHVLGFSQAELYIKLEQNLSSKQDQELNRLVQRRLNREPAAYITGHKEFFGLDFCVTAHTLIPRPETELLVEKALELVNDRRAPNCLIADVGTGCGAIAIALAVNLPQAEVYAIDISAPALEVAAVNCQKHEVRDRVHLLQGDIIGPLKETVDLVVANLPYISDSEMVGLNDEIRGFEPTLALAGGRDGLQKIRTLLFQAKDKLHPRGAILMEISPNQRTAVADLAREHFPKATVKAVPDLSGHNRVIIIQTGVKV